MKQLYLILFISFPVILFAQSNYHEGFVVKDNGDTLKGYINYQEWAYSPRSIEFKNNIADKEAKLFNPDAIRAFQITGMEFYSSYAGIISTNKNVFPNIPAGIDTSSIRGSIFLKRLVTGKYITLFYNNEVNKNRFFIAENGQSPVELKYYEYYNDERTHEVIHNSFRGQLQSYVYKFDNGNQKLLSSIDESHFEEQDLENAVDAINNVSIDQQGRIPNHKAEKSLSRFFIGTGVNILTTTYDYSTPAVAAQTHTTTTFAPKIDFGIDVFINPNVQQFIFRTVLSGSFSNNRFIAPALSATASNNDLSFSQYSLTVTPQILFSVYNADALKIYIDGGFAFNLSSYSNNGNNDIPEESKSFWPYIPLQAGIIFNKNIEISFMYTSFVNNAFYSGVNVTNKLTNSVSIKFLLN